MRMRGEKEYQVRNVKVQITGRLLDKKGEL